MSDNSDLEENSKPKNPQSREEADSGQSKDNIMQSQVFDFVEQTQYTYQTSKQEDATKTQIMQQSSFVNLAKDDMQSDGDDSPFVFDEQTSYEIVPPVEKSIEFNNSNSNIVFKQEEFELDFFVKDLAENSSSDFKTMKGASGKQSEINFPDLSSLQNQRVNEQYLPIPQNNNGQTERQDMDQRLSFSLIGHRYGRQSQRETATQGDISFAPPYDNFNDNLDKLDDFIRLSQNENQSKLDHKLIQRNALATDQSMASTTIDKTQKKQIEDQAQIQQKLQLAIDTVMSRQSEVSADRQQNQTSFLSTRHRDKKEIENNPTMKKERRNCLKTPVAPKNNFINYGTKLQNHIKSNKDHKKQVAYPMAQKDQIVLQENDDKEVGNQIANDKKIQLNSDDYIDSKSNDIHKEDPPSMLSFDDSMQLEIVSPQNDAEQAKTEIVNFGHKIQESEQQRIQYEAPESQNRGNEQSYNENIMRQIYPQSERQYQSLGNPYNNYQSSNNFQRVQPYYSPPARPLINAHYIQQPSMNFNRREYSGDYEAADERYYRMDQIHEAYPVNMQYDHYSNRSSPGLFCKSILIIIVFLLIVISIELGFGLLHHEKPKTQKFQNPQTYTSTPTYTYPYYSNPSYPYTTQPPETIKRIAWKPYTQQRPSVNIPLNNISKDIPRDIPQIHDHSWTNPTIKDIGPDSYKYQTQKDRQTLKEYVAKRFFDTFEHIKDKVKRSEVNHQKQPQTIKVLPFQVAHDNKTLLNKTAERVDDLYQKQKDKQDEQHKFKKGFLHQQFPHQQMQDHSIAKNLTKKDIEKVMDQYIRSKFHHDITPKQQFDKEFYEKFQEELKRVIKQQEYSSDESNWLAHEIVQRLYHMYEQEKQKKTQVHNSTSDMIVGWLHQIQQDLKKDTEDSLQRVLDYTNNETLKAQYTIESYQTQARNAFEQKRKELENTLKALNQTEEIYQKFKKDFQSHINETTKKIADVIISEKKSDDTKKRYLKDPYIDLDPMPKIDKSSHQAIKTKVSTQKTETDKEQDRQLKEELKYIKKLEKQIKQEISQEQKTTSDLEQKLQNVKTKEQQFEHQEKKKIDDLQQQIEQINKQQKMQFKAYQAKEDSKMYRMKQKYEQDMQKMLDHQKQLEQALKQKDDQLEEIETKFAKKLDQEIKDLKEYEKKKDREQKQEALQKLKILTQKEKEQIQQMKRENSKKMEALQKDFEKAEKYNKDSVKFESQIKESREKMATIQKELKDVLEKSKKEQSATKADKGAVEKDKGQSEQEGDKVVNQFEPKVCASGEGQPCQCHNGIIYYGERYKRSEKEGKLFIDYSHELSYQEMLEYPYRIKDMTSGGIMTMCSFMQFASEHTQWRSYYKVKSDKQCFCLQPKMVGSHDWNY